MLRFKYHKNAGRGFGYEELTDSRVTYTNFDTWKTFYFADKENWDLFINASSWEPYWIPAYRVPNPNRSYGWSYRYIKFLTARDYRKFIRFVKNVIRKGEDNENTKELLELTEIIRRRANEHLKEAHSQTAAALKQAEQEAEKYKNTLRHPTPLSFNTKEMEL
jgi:hypothetical protein